MNRLIQIPEPVLFNPLKHHLGFMREFIDYYVQTEENNYNPPAKELKHIGTSVMDVYTGLLPANIICNEVEEILKQKGLFQRDVFAAWTGANENDFRIISLSDASEWTIKFYDNKQRYIHIFPARNSQHTFRVKSNTLKSAILYNIIAGKDYVTGNDLNKARAILGLTPVKDPVDAEAITEMIEILRG
jgi:hypothetical protein